MPHNSNKYFGFFLLFVLFSQAFSYLYLSFRQLKNHQKTLPIFVSNIAGNDFDWLKKTIIGLFIITFVWFLDTIIQEITNIGELFWVSIIYLMGFYYIGVQVTRQKNVFPASKQERENIADLVEEQLLEEELLEEKLAINEVDNAKITENFDENSIIPTLLEILPERKKVMTDEELQKYKTQLLALMDNEKPYLDGEITLFALGQMLHLNTYQTSYLINNCFEENFYTFINRYRLEDCKRMLISEKYNHLSILGIAFEAGFNSKTAFNTSFKKYIGFSPKEFKEKFTEK